MYSIYADNLLIYDDTIPATELKVIEPKLVMEDSAAGSLDLTLPPTNVGYSVIEVMKTELIVKCDNEEIWRGRVIEESYDFWNNHSIICEGELAYLYDTIQPPHKYLTQSGTNTRDITYGTTISSFLRALISIHNSKVDNNKKFTVGMITVNDGDQLEDDDSIYRYTNYETTLECINEKLLKKLGGHIRVRRSGNVRYLDYIDDDTIGANGQIIEFGENLLDFSKNITATELCTVVVPRGEMLEEDEIEGLTSYLTVKSLGQKSRDGKVWHDNQSLYVQNPDAVSTFGRFEYVITWENVSDANVLYNKAVKYLVDEQYGKMVLEVKALDLHYLSTNVNRIKILDKIRCISNPHGMDHTFPVSKLEIILDEPSQSLYTLGTDVPLTLTKSNAQSNQSINTKINEIPSKSNILKEAQENAFQIINGVSGSYVHFITDPATGAINRIEVTDESSDDRSLNKWIFNSGGLGHMKRARYQNAWPQSMDVAMTMDGAIVADKITTGTLKAQNNQFTLNMSTGEVIMKSGKFYGQLVAATGTFSGQLSAATGTFSGQLSAATGSFSGSISATSGTIGSHATDGKRWKIGSTSIYNGCTGTGDTTEGTYIGTGGIRNNWYDTNGGLHYTRISGGSIAATNVDLTGKITATSGTIGGNSNSDNRWNIGGSSIYNGCTGVTNGTAGTYIGIDGIRNNWYDTNGDLHYTRISGGSMAATDVNLTGSITARSGYIGSDSTRRWTIGSLSIYNGCTGVGNETAGTYIGTDGIRNNWRDSSSNLHYTRISGGSIAATDVNLTGTINAKQGYIGSTASGFTINSQGLSNTETSSGAVATVKPSLFRSSQFVSNCHVSMAMDCSNQRIVINSDGNNANFIVSNARGWDTSGNLTNPESASNYTKITPSSIKMKSDGTEYTVGVGPIKMLHQSQERGDIGNLRISVSSDVVAFENVVSGKRYSLILQ